MQAIMIAGDFPNFFNSKSEIVTAVVLKFSPGEQIGGANSRCYTTYGQ